MAALLYLGNFKLTFKMMTKFLTVGARKPFRWLIPIFITTTSLQVPAGKENYLIFFSEKSLLFPRFTKSIAELCGFAVKVLYVFPVMQGNICSQISKQVSKINVSSAFSTCKNLQT